MSEEQQQFTIIETTTETWKTIYKIYASTKEEAREKYEAENYECERRSFYNELDREIEIREHDQ